MKLIIIFFISFWAINPGKSVLLSNEFTFPVNNILSRAKLEGTVPSSLSAYTLCHWFHTLSSDYTGAIFSYNAGNIDKVILTQIEKPGKLEIWHPSSQFKSTDSNYLTTRWVHSCITWSSTDGSWQIYVNGTRAAFGIGLSTGEIKSGQGTVILGQQQDSENGALDASQRFKGSVSEVHLWDYVLNEKSLVSVYRCNSGLMGNVINWQISRWSLYDGVILSTVHLPCGD